MTIMSNWLVTVNNMIKEFSDKHSAYYVKSERELFASFEIGCFLSLIDFYESRGCSVSLINLDEKTNQFKYLTTPSGNPDNFSYVFLKSENSQFEIRQQVRVKSHIDSEISFTPDIIVLKRTALINRTTRQDYANGKKGFFYVNSSDVIAAHECKSLPPFPELLVSFLGMLLTAHSWYEEGIYDEVINEHGLHLAPTLFVGGSAKTIHLKMITNMMMKFPINIFVGLHNGIWNLTQRENVSFLKEEIFYEVHSA